MLWFVYFFNYADRQAIFAVFPLIKQQLGLTDVQLGIVGAAFMWMYALFGPLAGWLCDRLPRKNLVLGGLNAWSLVTALTAVCHTYGQLVLCRALSGLGEAVYLPASMSLIGDYHSSATRSRAMSLHQSSVYDIVAVRQRGIAAGLLNSLGWLGGGFAPIAIALAANKYGMGPSISGTALVYCISGLLMLLAAQRTIFARSRQPIG
jgi:MFS family permease